MMNQLRIDRWFSPPSVLVEKYTELHARLNGWERNSDRFRAYWRKLYKQVEGAVTSGQLAIRDRDTELREPPCTLSEAGVDTVIFLQEYCDWATGIGLGGCPRDARDLAQHFGLPVSVTEDNAPPGAKEHLAKRRKARNTSEPSGKEMAPLPDWDYWRYMPDVEIWQACALSLNLDPDKLEWSRDAWMNGAGNYPPHVESKSFRNSGEEETFHKRVKLLSANLSNRQHFSAGIVNMAKPYRCHVRLPEFAAWAAEIGWTLPVGFPASSAIRESAESAAGAPLDSEARLKACMKSLRKRIAILPILRINPPAATRAGLVGTTYLLHLLSLRHVDRIESLELGASELHDDARVAKWYSDYCTAFVELAEQVQLAVSSKTLKLRSVRTRAELTPAVLAPWLAMDIRKTAEGQNLFSESWRWGEMDAGWPDARVAPRGGVYLDDAETWADGAGITRPCELRALVDQSESSRKCQPATLRPVTQAASAPSSPSRVSASWREVAFPYITAVQRRSRQPTAKALFNELERLAGSDDCPFVKGQGSNRGKLVVQAIGKAIALKTLQNCWADIQNTQMP